VILADEHGRDNIGEIELAFDENAKILGLRLHMLASIGAYVASDRQLLTPFGMIGTVVGVYDVPAAYVSIERCYRTPARRHPIAAPAGLRRFI
jgi:carbon-monoxide dehydrogenase large subunit